MPEAVPPPAPELPPPVAPPVAPEVEAAPELPPPLPPVDPPLEPPPGETQRPLSQICAGEQTGLQPLATSHVPFTHCSEFGQSPLDLQVTDWQTPW